MTLTDARVADIITYIDKYSSNTSGAIANYGKLVLEGSTEVTENSRGVSLYSGSLTLKDQAKIHGNTGINAYGNVSNGGGVYVSKGSKLVGVNYDSAGNSNNIFNNKPDNIYFAQ